MVRTQFMSKNAAVHVRIEPQTKKKAETVLKKLGLSPTEAIRLFYHQICLRGGLPFQVVVPNELTAKTLTRSQAGQEIQTFETVEDLFRSWDE